MIIGVMRIERTCVAFVAGVDDILVSIREQLPQRERRREDRATTRRGAQPPNAASDEAQGSYCLRAEGPRTEIHFVRLTRRYIPIVRVTGVR